MPVIFFALGGLAVWYVTKIHSGKPYQAPTPVGEKAVTTGFQGSTTAGWKIDYPTPTGLWGNRLYGWRGEPAQTYLAQMNATSRACPPVAGSNAVPPATDPGTVTVTPYSVSTSP